MKQAVATVTSKGQVTIPAEVRKHLGVGAKDKVSFVITDDGDVRVERVKYPTIASITGIAGSLSKPLSWEEVQEIAHDDVAERYRGKHVKDK